MVAENNVNMKKSIVFLYTSKQSRNKIRKTIQCTTASKIVKYLAIDLRKRSARCKACTLKTPNIIERN